MDYVSHCLTNGILLYSKGMQLQLSFDMLGRFLKNCAGIEKYQFCLWSGKVASKAKEAEVPEKEKKSILWKVQIYDEIYIYIESKNRQTTYHINPYIKPYIKASIAAPLPGARLATCGTLPDESESQSKTWPYEAAGR